MKLLSAEFLDWFRGQKVLMNKYPSMAEYITRNKKAIDWELRQAAMYIDPENPNNSDDNDYVY